jgi:Putative addiction module component
MAYFVWLDRSSARTFVIDTGFNKAAAERRSRDFLLSPVDGLTLLGVDEGEDVEREWAQIADERDAELEAGKVSAVDGRTVLARLRTEYPG